MDFQQYYEARDIIEDFIEKDLVGPLAEDEKFSDTDPLRYYSMGILYPQNFKIGQEETEKDQLEDETTLADQALNLCNSTFPSSFGLSFTVKPNTPSFNINYRFAWYVAEEKQSHKDEHPYTWFRKCKSGHVTCDCSNGHTPFEIAPGLKIDVYMQKKYNDGSRTYAVVMINTNIAGSDLKSNNERSVFQPKMWLTGSNGAEDIFVERRQRIQLKKDPELLNLDMLYRHQKAFALGHGCGVDWEATGEYSRSLSTEFLPRFSVMQMRPPVHIKKSALSWDFLATQPTEEVMSALSSLANSYKSWIEEQRRSCASLGAEFQVQAKNNLDLCEETLSRIQMSVMLLKDNDVFKAFQLANQVMLEQRVQSLNAINQSFVKEDLGWYPFQLAFVLQELGSIINPEDKYRDIVDLLWFPTGGGKTEAYLGLSAFAIFYRRIRSQHDESGAGVTIIMRYTLRLLTLQQFQRAATMICAAELLRRNMPKLLGKTPISIGLWVGGGLTPNSMKDAVSGLEKIRKDGFDNLREGDHNPCQILTCPWCGSDIGPMNYHISDSKMIIKCSSKTCQFASGLPLHLIDEQIYTEKPTLIVSTIDKFARMTWEPRVSELFGIRDGFRAPELIIQDELHLISGPLGTIAGLYELAIDYFCSLNGMKPKIIASTATIRNAQSQILGLYGRNHRQFPPQGVDIRDSYFAEEAGKDVGPTRRYVGIMGPGKSATTMFVRIFAILLYATRYLKDLGYEDEVVDSFWTLTGYFNSLKQLGGAMVHVLDDVQARLKYLYGTKFKDYNSVPFTSEREFTHHAELTSRNSSIEIGKILKNLEVQYPDKESYDYVMASNMISVGVDVSRLGLMIVNGQPKSNAEYIQATSRVGRRTPGLVVVLQDAGRSRDRSHYEQFRSYHSAFYKHVEATSITPFSERARDRALHAVLISLCRHIINDLKENDAAGRINDYTTQVDEFVAYILRKVSVIDAREKDATENHIQQIIEEWKAKSSSDLVYQRRKTGVPLLIDFDSGAEEGFPTLNSMRSVDTQSKVSLEG